MSINYQRAIQEDFDDDGADAMEYEPSEKSLDQKSLLEDIPEPFQYENTNETLAEASRLHENFPGTSYFGNPHTIPPGTHYYNHHNDASQNMSSFLNLSDSVSQKEGNSRAVAEKSMENVMANESMSRTNQENIQELKQQIVELKRKLSIKDQDLMYAQQRNAKMTNELNAQKDSAPTTVPESNNFKALIQENEFLKEKLKETEEEITRMNEYIEEELKDANQSQYLDIMQKQKEENEKLQNDKNQLLDFIEQSMNEHEKLGSFAENLKEENKKLAEEINNLRNGHNQSKTETEKYDNDRHNFDTFGGDNDDSVTKIQLQKAQEAIEKLQDDLRKATEQRNIENRSKETNIKNLRQKLEIAEKAHDDYDKCIKEVESHYKEEIETIQKSLDTCKNNLKEVTKTKDKLDSELDELKNENSDLQNKYKKVTDNYSALEATCNETQAELDEIKEKYERHANDNSLKERCHELKLQCQQYEKENENLVTLNNQQADTVELKTDKILQLTEQMRELESKINKATNDNTHLLRELDAARNISDNTDYQNLMHDFNTLQDEIHEKNQNFDEMKHDFSRKLSEFQQLSQDFHQLKRDYQDLEYNFNNLDSQKREKDERLKQAAKQNDELSEKLQKVMAESTKQKTAEIEDAKRRVQESEEHKNVFEKYLKQSKIKANECARLVDEFNDTFLTFAKEETFDKKLISRKFRDFMILSDKIKPAKDHYEIQDVLEKVEEWILHSAEEFEIQMKNAANFKRKFLKVSERVDTLEDYQMTATNEEKKFVKREEELKREIITLNTKLGQIESEKSCSYKREDKVARQLQNLKQDVKNYSKENNRLSAQVKAIQQEKEKLQREIKEVHKSKEFDIEKTKDLEQRIFQLLYEKDSIMEMLSTLERSIPSTEIRRLFSDFINNQKELFSLDEEKNTLETELLNKEKELRSTAKHEQLTSKVINMRKDIEKMRKDLSNIDSQMEETKAHISSLKDELHCVEIHEKRRNEVIFDTERALLENKEENEVLKREVGYLTNTKDDLERAYRSMLEEKKLMDRELMTLRSQMGSINNSVYTTKQGNFTSTLNPGDFQKNRFLQNPNVEYSTTNMGGGIPDASSFVSHGMGNTYTHNFYQKESETDQDIEGEDQIIEESYESESAYEPKEREEMPYLDKINQAKETLNFLRNSINKSDN